MVVGGKKKAVRMRHGREGETGGGFDFLRRHDPRQVRRVYSARRKISASTYREAPLSCEGNSVVRRAACQEGGNEGVSSSLWPDLIPMPLRIGENLLHSLFEAIGHR